MLLCTAPGRACVENKNGEHHRLHAFVCQIYVHIVWSRSSTGENTSVGHRCGDQGS